MITKTYYIESPARLSTKLEQLIIEQNSGESEAIKTSRPLEDAGMLILDHSQILITTPLLQNCLNRNVPIIVCDSRHLPSGILVPMAGHSLSGLRMRSQIDSSKPLKKKLWQITICAKIRNQALVLKQLKLPYKILMEASQKVRSGDSSNIEATAAAYYWSKLFGDKTGFRRDRFGESPNHALNYTYSVIRAVVARSLIGSGLFPFMGIHHKNAYNSLCLADDIMEPFRPYADKLVRDLVSREIVPADECELNKEIRALCLGILNRDVMLDGLKRPLQIAVNTVCSKLAQCFETGDSTLLVFPEYE
ncbi:MAG: type II CRISPR-associated endonuclease Cas1 [Saprospiraceae bacterium]|nr:type II CRISPR-associated endonuclease Cas1 [Saprospiraceae bacterium]HRG67514.1 type II CRISPR-associated endonuclease Cas1 [Saprospiraceae bacterium]